MWPLPRPIPSHKFLNFDSKLVGRKIIKVFRGLCHSYCSKHLLTFMFKPRETVLQPYWETSSGTIRDGLSVFVVGRVVGDCGFVVKGTSGWEHKTRRSVVYVYHLITFSVPDGTVTLLFFFPLEKSLETVVTWLLGDPRVLGPGPYTSNCSRTTDRGRVRRVSETEYRRTSLCGNKRGDFIIREIVSF